MSGSFEIFEITSDKRRFMPLLLVGDESEDMICRYIEASDLYVGFSGEVAVAVCATLAIDETVVEVKNLAVSTDFRHRGIGRSMLRYVERVNPGKAIILGTGETPSTLRFYRNCGYRYSHRIPGFFTDNYPDPIVEEGVTLRDMIYLRKDTDVAASACEW